MKFTGGREGGLYEKSLVYDRSTLMTAWSDLLPLVVGILKGYDQLLNLVLDEVEETLQGAIASYHFGTFYFKFSNYDLFRTRATHKEAWISCPERAYDHDHQSNRRFGRNRESLHCSGVIHIVYLPFGYGSSFCTSKVFAT